MSVRSSALAIAMAVLLGACGSAGTAVNSVTPSPAPTASQSPTCTPSQSPLPSASPSPSVAPSPSPSLVPSPSPAPSSVPATHLIQIVVSKQHLWAYEGQTVIVSTDVATGRPDLPTVIGHFHVLAKYSPYLFVSPWPKGSPYYYDPTWVQYAMLFAAGGYFIHDAAWQRNWGPGANIRSGSHGCVNVPPASMALLYRWARVGDDVIVSSS
jgi:lipoprotein-anchoring transpeptidase ErfK/SrfK